MHTSPGRILIANRGEIALRIARTARELDLESVAVHAAEEPRPAHAALAHETLLLEGTGPGAYLNEDALIAAAQKTGCTLIHPGYGFLSERASFAERCTTAGICFIGPSAEALNRLGDKAQARQLASALAIPVIDAVIADSVTSLQDFLVTLPAGQTGILKAIAGGGGRGMRVVHPGDDLASVFASCQAEAQAAFGEGALYVERYLNRVRHIEVQVACDRTGRAISLGDRDCSLQRGHQKVLELAPSPHLDASLRTALHEAATRLVSAAACTGLSTVEFLVPLDAHNDFRFIEVNPRLQVEHTVTEQVTGLDLVALQIRLAQGALLKDCGLSETPVMRGIALQCRINAETLVGVRRLAAHGTVQSLSFGGGPGVRTDSALRNGDVLSGLYDSLVAKVVVHAENAESCLARTKRALQETVITGFNTNLPELRTLIESIDAAELGRLDTAYLAHHDASLPSAETEDAFSDETGITSSNTTTETDTQNGLSSSRMEVTAPVTGLLSRWIANTGDMLKAGATMAYLNSMKMDIAITAPCAGVFEKCLVATGALVHAGARLCTLTTTPDTDDTTDTHEVTDPDHLPAALTESLERHAKTLDEARPAAVARRQKTGQRTARQNVDDLLDPGSFIEYGALAVAGQRRRRPMQQLIDQSPADGLITGMGTVNAGLVGEDHARCMVLAYDYTVFAGTQGLVNHKKADRMLHLAERWRLPVVLFAEGGGGRPGDTDFSGVSALDSPTFKDLATLSGLVPLIGIVSGRCFAGNAALLGCCDVIIATKNASIGMAGPAMIEGGGLGRFSPEEVGPTSVQAPNGVIDILVENEAEAVDVAKRYLGCFQSRLKDWKCQDQRLLRHVIPENRRLAFDVRRIIDTVADEGSFIELRRAFARGMITGFLRIEGVCFGVMANDCREQGGAIDAAGGDKAARFLQLCDAFDMPVISLCDTPGFMVGPDAEKQATVRHVSRMFVTAASLEIPVFTVVLRKGYGLGAQAMAAGSFHAPFFTVSWPSGEFGAMGLEGAVRLGYAKELAAIDPPARREKFFRRLVRKAHQQGKAINIASHLEIDDVIDPASTRAWIMAGWRSTPKKQHREGKKRRFIDTW